MALNAEKNNCFLQFAATGVHNRILRRALAGFFVAFVSLCKNCRVSDHPRQFHRSKLQVEQVQPETRFLGAPQQRRIYTHPDNVVSKAKST
jgi:hypothetical protein